MNMLNKSQEYDSYEIDEPSDEDRAASSSEDELDVLLNGTAEQKKKLIREYLTGESESSSDDDFEKEMETELSSTIRNMEGTWGPTADGADGGAGSSGAEVPGVPKPRTYDKVYFDSDSEEEEEEDAQGSSSDRKRRQRIIPTNDELLYDPDEDDRDQAWVDARRYNGRKRPNAASRAQPHKPPRLPSSDAVLNCPACMTTLCLDCQRHEKYRTQYRAMFVMNCTVKKDEVLRYKTQELRNPRKRRRGRKVEAPADAATTSLDPEEVYHPVTCSECSTEVAVFDTDEVYHFFNILASHC